MITVCSQHASDNDYSWGQGKTVALVFGKQSLGFVLRMPGMHPMSESEAKRPDRVQYTPGQHQDCFGVHVPFEEAVLEGREQKYLGVFLTAKTVFSDGNIWPRHVQHVLRRPLEAGVCVVCLPSHSPGGRPQRG